MSNTINVASLAKQTRDHLLGGGRDQIAKRTEALV